MWSQSKIAGGHLREYDYAMFCPNEKTRMHLVSVESHYGQQVLIDQCRGCGGIWFDAFELYKVKQGEAQEIEALDSDVLRAPSDIENPTLRCPRDQSTLVRFSDPNFPKGLVLARCPNCQGFWLNRGEFTRYQEAREKRTLPGDKTLEDQKLGEDVKRLLESHRGNSSAEVLGNLATYLSSPAHTHVFSPLGSGRELTEEEKPLDTILNVLLALLRLFILRLP